MAGVVVGRINWNAHDDDDGHRNYDIEWLIRSTRDDDGPQVIRATPNLPVIGSPWRFGRDDDPHAWCHPGWRVEPVLTKEKGHYWTVQQLFSTRPLDGQDGGGGGQCADQDFETPLQVPPSISGTFVKYLKEVAYDRHGKLLKYTSHELIQGKPTEFDHNRPQVTIELNTLILPLATFARMVDTVNELGMWELDPRMVKLSNVSWSREVFGTCALYFKIRYEFDIDFKTFDRKEPSFGNKCLVGWSPGSPFADVAADPISDVIWGDDAYLDQRVFEQCLDKNGSQTALFLDEFGVPVQNPEDAFQIDIEHYPESNFFELGIPPDLIA